MSRQFPARGFPGAARGIRKPLNPVLDFTHQISRGRVLCIPLGDNATANPKELVAGQQTTVTTGPLALASSHHGGLSTSFNGTFQQISSPSSGTLDSTYGTWTAWIKTSSLSGGFPMILSRASSSSTNGVSLFLDGSTAQLRTQIKGAGGVVDIQGGASLIDGIWHFVALTFSPSGGPATLYVDGVSVATANASGAWSFAANPFLIAGSQDSFWRYFLGSIENINIFSRVLSGSEIRALYAEPYAGIYPVGIPSIVGIAAAASTTPWQSLVQDNQPQPDIRQAVAI